LIASPAPIKSFTGIKDDNTVIPPDVMGGAGPDHLMETLNNYYRIFSKAGSAVLKIVPSTFWSALGTYQGDPISHTILYPIVGSIAVLAACKIRTALNIARLSFAGI
jgi:hypothetical protein